MPIECLRDKFLAIFQDVAYLHSKGFTHSDIKPENIGITPKMN
jgi:serine/threonine protein kinase